MSSPGLSEAAAVRSVHVGRQPLFDAGRSTIGYELLFRGQATSTTSGAESGIDPGDAATTAVILATFTSFGLRQLVDIAMKALSPGINDTTTAVMCVDRLSSLLCLLAGRNLASPLRAEAGQVRVLTLEPDFASYLGTAFDQIRANAASALAIYLRQLEALRTICAQCPAAYHVALRQQADLTLATAETHLTTRYDLDQVQALYRELRDELMGLPGAIS